MIKGQSLPGCIYMSQPNFDNDLSTSNFFIYYVQVDLWKKPLYVYEELNVTPIQTYLVTFNF